MATLTELTFLGTGNFLAAGRYWNSFVIDRSILVEPSPTALPHLRRSGISVEELDIVVVSHFHADHTFGWPFLLLEFVKSRRVRPLTVLGPPGVEAYFDTLLDVGGVPNIAAAARRLDLRFAELTGGWQQEAGIRVRGVEVEHVDHLRCFGFLFERSTIVGYTGDTRPCDGLTEIAASCDVLVTECNDHHAPSHLPLTHMDVPSVRRLQELHPQVRFVLTHLGDDVRAEDIPGAVVPGDFDVLTF